MQATYISVALSGSITYRYRQGRLPVATQITDYSMAFARNSDLRPGCSRVSDPDVALGGSTGLDITMASGGSTGHSDQFAPSLLEAAWPTEVGSGCSTDHRGLYGPQW